MVLVVVPMHAIAAHREEVRERGQVIPHETNLAVLTEIRGIGLGYADDRSIQDVPAVDETDLLEFACSKLKEASVVQAPEIVAFMAEIL